MGWKRRRRNQSSRRRKGTTRTHDQLFFFFLFLSVFSFPAKKSKSAIRAEEANPGEVKGPEDPEEDLLPCILTILLIILITSNSMEGGWIHPEEEVVVVGPFIGALDREGPAGIRISRNNNNTATLR